MSATVTLLLCASLLASEAPTLPQADFAAANERLLAGDAGAAIALYQHLESRGVAARDLSFNLGVALAKAGRSVEAIVAFERALRLDPSFDDAKTNLAILRARFPKRGASVEDAPTALADVLEPIVAPFDPDTIAITTVLLVGALSTLLLLRRFERAQGRGWLALGVALGVSATLGVAIAGAQAAVRADPRAIVTATRALKEGPEPRFSDVATITAGERVRVERELGGYAEVRASDGVTGWLPITDLTRI